MLTGAFIFLCIATALFRLYYTTEIMTITGDTLRLIIHGIYVNQQGLSAAGQSLTDQSEIYGRIAWSYLPWNYPAIALLFFTLISKTLPTLFFAKLILTAIEACNAWLVYRFSGNRWLGLIYWMSPVSMWWASHEGQFEPLQNLFVLLALVLLARRPAWSLVMLAIAIQVKLTAGAFLPYFAYRIYKDYREDMIKIAAVFAAGFIPTLITMYFYPALSQIFSTLETLVYNPWYFDFSNRAMAGEVPATIWFVDQLVSSLLLLVLLVCIATQRLKFHYAPPLIFMLFAAFSTKFLGWYWLVLMPFLLVIPNHRLRLQLFALSFLIDISVYYEMLGLLGSNLDDYYAGIGVFDNLGKLFNIY